MLEQQLQTRAPTLKPTAAPTKCYYCAGDFNGDNTVSASDLLALLSKPAFSGSGAPTTKIRAGEIAKCDGDIDADGKASIHDVLTLLSIYGSKSSEGCCKKC